MLAKLTNAWVCCFDLSLAISLGNLLNLLEAVRGPLTIVQGLYSHVVTRCIAVSLERNKYTVLHSPLIDVCDILFELKLEECTCT